MEICVYGAGNYAREYIPILAERFTIRYLLDRSPKKAGGRVYGYPVMLPDRENVNRYPVLILLADVMSAVKSLEEYKCSQTLLYFFSVAGGFGVAEYYHARISVQAICDSAIFIAKESEDFSKVKILENKGAVKEKAPRIFNMASPGDFDAAGGPCACLRNLWLANEQFQMIDNFYTLCPSTAYVPKGARYRSAAESIAGEKEFIKTLFEFAREGSMETIRFYLSLCYWTDFLYQANERFLFTEEDIFLLQDPLIAYLFVFCFPVCKKTVLVCHTQGSVSNEWAKKAPELKDVYDAMQEETMDKIRHWVFPSKGALQGFVETSSLSMRQAFRTCWTHIAYNGYERKEQIHADEVFLNRMKHFPQADLTFASATFLYRNKGVERIPRILAEWKRLTGLKIHWILVGSGEMEDLVEENIKKYLETSDYTWYKDRFDNQDNIFALFKYADFYIMMHRVSVFDLSTLQAMSYGCIPVLSDVGGNLELCGYENGILIDAQREETVAEALTEYMEGKTWQFGKMREKQEVNQQIVRERFHNKAFLQYYRDILNEVNGSDEKDS